MADLLDPDILVEDPPDELEVAVAREDLSPMPVHLIDYAVADIEPYRLAPLVMQAKDADRLLLQPGLNVVDGRTWAVYSARADVVGHIEAGELVVLPKIPRRLAELEALVVRTFCPNGLGAIEAAERATYGDSPRKVVMAMLETQRARIRKCREKPA